MKRQRLYLATTGPGPQHPAARALASMADRPVNGTTSRTPRELLEREPLAVAGIGLVVLLLARALRVDDELRATQLRCRVLEVTLGREYASDLEDLDEHHDWEG